MLVLYILCLKLANMRGDIVKNVYLKKIKSLFSLSKLANQTLETDAKILTNITAYIVRSSFWAVLIVGIADFLISFLVVEKCPFVIGRLIFFSFSKKTLKKIGC